MKKLSVFILAFAAMACNSTNNGNQTSATDKSLPPLETEQTVATTKPIEELDGRWFVTKLYSTAVSDSNVYVNFNIAENRIGAYAGCNHIGAEINQKNRSVGSLSFDKMATTQMLCPEKDETERALAGALGSTLRYEFIGETLVLLNEDGEGIVELKR